MKKYQGYLACAFLCSGVTAFAKPMTATLTLLERVSMQQLATNVLDPNSDRFEIYYTPEEIRELAAPSDKDYNHLLKTLAAEGFSVVYESKSHLMVTIKGDHTNFEKMFKTRIQFSGESFHSNSLQPQIPSQLAIVKSISGLNNTRTFKPRYKVYPTFNELDEQPGILPDDVKAAYDMTALYDRGLTGKDQHIAIATYMNFAMDDVTQYYSKIGLDPVPTVDVVSFNGEAPYEAGSAGETELDTELSGMMAPGSNIHVFTSAENSDQGELALFTAVLDDNRAKLVNYSWGSCETYVNESHRPSMDSVFARAVAQGVSLLVASGDNGSDGCGDGTVVADWPAAHPSVVAVGGTSVYLNANGSKREKGWSGSGGGVSSHYKLPKWQSDFKAPYKRRAFPDIAFNADPSTGEGIWVRSSFNSSPSWIQVGGTSMAAPQWVGFLALVNEARHEKGKQPLGFLNPIFYKISKKNREAVFTDITLGKNGAYSAGKGWDAVTGWGSMKGSAMLNHLLSH